MKTTNRFQLRSAKFLSCTRFLSKWVVPLAILVAAILALASPGVESRAGVEGVANAAVPVSPVSPASSEPVVTADLLGLSGKLRAVMGTTDALDQNPELKPLLEGSSTSEAWPRLLTPDG